MNIKELKTRIDWIQELKENKKSVRFKKIKLKKMKDEVLNILSEETTTIGDYVAHKTNTTPQYLQIFTKDSWKRAQKYFKDKNGI